MNSREKGQIRDALATLQSRGDQFTRQLLNEKRRISQLEAKLKDVNTKIAQLRESNKDRAVELLRIHKTATHHANGSISRNSNFSSQSKSKSNSKAQTSYSHPRADGLDPTRLAELNQAKLATNLEKRLDNALIRRNTIQSENDAIKTEIDRLRRKVSNDNSHRQILEKELRKIRDDVEDVLGRAAVVSEQRDRIVEKKNQLARENTEERERFREEYERLAVVLSERRVLLENSIASVAKDIVSRFQTMDGAGAGDATSLPSSVHGNGNHSGNDNGAGGKDGNGGDTVPDPMDEVKALDEKIAELDRQHETNKKLLKRTEEKNRQYEETFSKLREVTGLSTTEDIIAAFVKNDEEAFSIFNYVQTVNQECDNTLEQRVRLEEEIESYAKEQIEREEQRVSIVGQYEKHLKEACEEREKLTDSTREGKKTILRISKKVQSLYIKLKCRQLDDDGMRCVSGQNGAPPTAAASNRRIGRMDRKLTMFTGEEISERNILHHMELIEKRSIQIIAEYAKQLAYSRKGQRRPSVLLSPKTFERNLASARTDVDVDVDRDETATLVVSDDCNSSDDDDSSGGRPMSVHDMRKQAAEKMKKPQTPEMRNHNHHHHHHRSSKLFPE